MTGDEMVAAGATTAGRLDRAKLMHAASQVKSDRASARRHAHPRRHGVPDPDFPGTLGPAGICVEMAAPALLRRWCQQCVGRGEVPDDAGCRGGPRHRRKLPARPPVPLLRRSKMFDLPCGRQDRRFGAGRSRRSSLVDTWKPSAPVPVPRHRGRLHAQYPAFTGASAPRVVAARAGRVATVGTGLYARGTGTADGGTGQARTSFLHFVRRRAHSV